MSESNKNYFVVATVNGSDEIDFYAFYNEQDAKKRYVDSVENRINTRSLNECVFLFPYPRSGLPLKPHTTAEIQDDIVRLCQEAKIRFIGPDVDPTKWESPERQEVINYLQERYAVLSLQLQSLETDANVTHKESLRKVWEWGLEEIRETLAQFRGPLPELF